MGFPLPWPHGYTPSTTSIAGTELAIETGVLARGKSRLLHQFQGKPRIEALLGVMLEPLQEMHIALWQLLVERTIDNATTDSLRVLARIVGIYGFDSSDDSLLRRYIRAVILVRRSSGTGNELINVVRAFVGTTAIRLVPYYPATVVIRVDEELDSAAETRLLGLLLRSAASAGVRMIFEYLAAPLIESFMFAESVDHDESSDALGFGDDDDTIGGRLLGADTGEE